MVLVGGHLLGGLVDAHKYKIGPAQNGSVLDLPYLGSVVSEPPPAIPSFDYKELVMTNWSISQWRDIYESGYMGRATEIARLDPFIRDSLLPFPLQHLPKAVLVAS